MNIRQNCIFSFEDALKMQPKSRLEKIIDTLDLQPVLAILNTPDKRKGGPTPYPGAAMLNAMIAMRLTNMTTFTSLVERLTYDPYLRYVCGFEPFGTAPSISCFSRFYAKLAESGCLETLFSLLVKQAEGMGLLDLTAVAIDATKVEAYEKSVPRKNISQDGNAADCGIKSDTNGNPIKWFGYKLHIGTDVKSGLPIAMKVTPANYSDSSVALDLVKQCFANVQTPIEYFLMDAGYDHREIYSLIRDKYQAQAIIALNKRGAKQPPASFDWDGTPICSAGYRMVYWGSCRRVNKFRCLHVMGKCDCPFGSAWCSDSLVVVMASIPIKFSFIVTCTTDDNHD